MTRWLLILICALALAGTASAQDDLDALLAGLGDEPVAADVTAPAPASIAEGTPAAEAPTASDAVEDPFADLLSPAEAPETSAMESVAEEMPAEILTVETAAEEVPDEASATDAASADPFGDLLGDDWVADEAPVATDAAIADEIPAAEAATEDPFADLLSPSEELAIETDVEEIPAEAPAPQAIDEDPFADLMDNDWAADEAPAIVETDAEPIDQPVAEEIPAAEDSVNDLLGEDWAEQPAASEVSSQDESAEMPDAPESTSSEDVNAALGILSDAAEEKAPATVEGAFVVAPAKEAKMPKAKIDNKEADASKKDVQVEKTEDNTPDVQKNEKAKTSAPKTDLKPRVADKVPDWNQPVVW